MLMEGFRLMLVGMTVVFCFLTLLVFAMHLSAAFFARFAAYFPEPQAAGGGQASGITHEIAAAIAAVYAYTKD